MNKDIPIEQKRGFTTDSEYCILVKADVNSISEIFCKYFELKVYPNCKPRKFFNLYNQYNNKEIRLSSIFYHNISVDYKNKIKNKIDNLLYPFPTWRFKNHCWSILGFKGNQYDIAYAFSSLLKTDVITYWMPKHDDCSELKLFRGDKLIEHYQFGHQCGTPRDNYWDVIVDLYPYIGLESHRFCSSIRRVTEVKIKQAINRKINPANNCGFLDDCVKFYDAYFPTEEENPYCYIYPRSNIRMSQFTNALEQMDIVMLPNNWNYRDWKVPQEVIKD